MTRFNIQGKDINRNWDKQADSILCPEKYALEKFITGLISKGIKPCLGIDIHNDDDGGIHLAQHSKDDFQFVKNMQFFEKLMREHTSFSENVVYSWKTNGESESNVQFENGLLSRYGIEAMVYELNANWISSLNKMPSQKDWIKIGENLNNVFYEYFMCVKCYYIRSYILSKVAASEEVLIEVLNFVLCFDDFSFNMCKSLTEE